MSVEEWVLHPLELFDLPPRERAFQIPTTSRRKTFLRSLLAEGFRRLNVTVQKALAEALSLYPQAAWAFSDSKMLPDDDAPLKRIGGCVGTLFRSV